MVKRFTLTKGFTGEQMPRSSPENTVRQFGCVKGFGCPPRRRHGETRTTKDATKDVLKLRWPEGETKSLNCPSRDSPEFAEEMGVTEFVTQNDEVGDDKALGKLPMGSDLGAHLKMVKVPAGITFKWKALGQRTETNFDQLSLPAYKVVTRIESTALERLGRFLRSLRTRLFSTFRHGFHCQLLASTWGRVPYGGVEIDGDGNVCALGGSLFLLGLDRPFFARRGKVWYFLGAAVTFQQSQ